MGGYGSGRTATGDRKPTTGDCRSLDVNFLARGGHLAPGQRRQFQWEREDSPAVSIETGPGRLTLAYGAGRESVTQDVEVCTTACRLGGMRVWFLCPDCSRRCAKLYLLAPPGQRGGGAFSCRLCHGLAYPVQSEPRSLALLRAARKVRRRLGGGDPEEEEAPPKPRHMHWRTYHRLVEREDALLLAKEEEEWRTYTRLMERVERWHAARTGG